MAMIFVKLTILDLVSLERVGLDILGLFHKFLILNFHEHLGDRGVKGW